jgi:hypothetical protein
LAGNWFVSDLLTVSENAGRPENYTRKKNEIYPLKYIPVFF